MKKIFTVLIILAGIVCAPVANAHDKDKHGKSREEMRRELREYKLNFLAEEMDLDEAAKAKFAEIFEENFDAQSQLFRESHKAKKELDAKKNPTDEDYNAYQKVQNSVKQREQALDARYRDKLSKVLNSKQMYKLQQGEEKFRAKMQEMKAKRKKNK